MANKRTAGGYKLGTQGRKRIKYKEQDKKNEEKNFTVTHGRIPSP
jgi:hypothetical protein